MPRTLTAAHRRRLAEGRVRAARLRCTTEDRQLRVWREWLRSEAATYHEVLSARLSHGEQSREALAAYKAWRRVSKHEPPRPPDSAFKRSRGEVGEHDSK